MQLIDIDKSGPEPKQINSSSSYYNSQSESSQSCIESLVKENKKEFPLP